ncbi:MAG: phytoene/squalene synthase family protein [Marinilabiliaceae bacterium]|nr:phytoene/squalene synthase family protein [Marinilabiliaceae bacterium]
MGVDFYLDNSYQVAKLVTKNYSTSFSIATSLFEKKIRLAIYAIYGFVRLADEIVDSFNGYDQPFLLEKLNNDLIEALKNGISHNCIIAAFAHTVKIYQIDIKHITAFMESMKYDLVKTEYTTIGDLDRYIYGSADVVGLMCLKVFCNEQPALYEQLKIPAQKLGSAFQKVNFLRDLKNDLNKLGRSYFPEITNGKFDSDTKRIIEQSIEDDFNHAWIGVRCLPGRSKLAVALAFYYYKGLFRKIKQASPDTVISKRIRISNLRKYMIIISVMIKYKIRII